MSARITTLPSGLRVVTDAMPHLETASLGVWIGAGSRHESRSEHGLSHLLEHMAFKGTKRRSARAIAEEIEAAGGDLNAATSTEHTAYYAHVLAEDAPLAVDILADILTESTFDKEELEREKGVILQEIGAVDDTPDDLVFDLFNATAFPGQPIGRPILGTPDQIASFGREAIGAYLDSHYASDATVIGAAGAIDHEQICDEVERRFSALAPRAAAAAAPAAVYQGGEIRLKRRLEQAHIVIGFEGLSYASEEFYALQVFANAVGGGMSSRLFQEVRETRGLAYSIHAFHWGYSDTGLFGFYAATSAKDVAELMPVALDCLAEAALSLSEDEARRAKAQMKVSLLTALESPSPRCEQIARQVMAFDRVLSREEIIGAIDRLDIADIRAAGAQALRSNPTVAAIGPVSKVPAPDRVAQRLRAS
ncbi:peptidase M16 domain protein [Methylocella silvestris BL2]|uniref:Peptidase M16 domain protein n=1 Tax=Methylocella silvestris (strain DSM 15510 / CIP 108128 / LMG 27833 / NCIMB 13906 / BL2) TaxID=395965 RepID=B8EPL6_METSB|nr:pitrilysin family protein [Methylocella silvestris]ACK50221.1 peptidase M16 domain protein [Methylocella silvestris BL2]